MFNNSRLVKALESSEFEGIVAATRENILYLAGFDPVIKTLRKYEGQCFVVVCRHDPNLIHVVHSVGESDQICDANNRIGRVFLYGTFYRYDGDGVQKTIDERTIQGWERARIPSNDGIEALALLLAELDLEPNKLGFDCDGISESQIKKLCKKFKISSLKNSSQIFRWIRMVKVDAEVETLSHAALVLEAAIEDAIFEIRHGTNELQLVQKLESRLVNEGARPELSMLHIGRAAAMGQRRPQKDVYVQDGDVIWFDADASYHGYWSDIARTASYGSRHKSLRYYDCLLIGQRTAIEKIRPGMTGAEVFHLTMTAVHRAGFSEYRRHHVGHGIGLEAYEEPILAPTSTTTIEEGMVLSIETPYYEYGLGALHIEDPIYVGKEKNRVLTRGNGQIKLLK